MSDIYHNSLKSLVHWHKFSSFHSLWCVHWYKLCPVFSHLCCMQWHSFSCFQSLMVRSLSSSCLEMWTADWQEESQQRSCYCSYHRFCFCCFEPSGDVSNKQTVTNTLSPSENIPMWYELKLLYYPLPTRLRCLLVSDVWYFSTNIKHLWWMSYRKCDDELVSLILNHQLNLQLFFYRLSAHCWSVMALTEKAVKSQCTLQTTDR